MYYHELEKLTENELISLQNKIREIQKVREQVKYTGVELSDDEKYLITRVRNPIEALKRYKNRTGCSLMYAKFVVDKFRAS